MLQSAVYSMFTFSGFAKKEESPSAACADDGRVVCGSVNGGSLAPKLEFEFHFFLAYVKIHSRIR